MSSEPRQGARVGLKIYGHLGAEKERVFDVSLVKHRSNIGK